MTGCHSFDDNNNNNNNIFLYDFFLRTVELQIEKQPVRVLPESVSDLTVIVRSDTVPLVTRVNMTMLKAEVTFIISHCRRYGTVMLIYETISQKL